MLVVCSFDVQDMIQMKKQEVLEKRHRPTRFQSFARVVVKNEGPKRTTFRRSHVILTRGEIPRPVMPYLFCPVYLRRFEAWPTLA